MIPNITAFTTQSHRAFPNANIESRVTPARHRDDVSVRRLTRLITTMSLQRVTP